MSYIDKNYYDNTYKPKTTTADTVEFDRLLDSSQEVIDYLTFERITYYGFDNLSAFRQLMIKTAQCTLIDYWLSSGIDINEIDASNGLDIKLGQFAIKPAAGQNSVTQIPLVNSRTSNLLKRSGLHYRGIGGV